jgi:serine/threonine protein kinase
MECCKDGDLSRFVDPEDPQYPRFQGGPQATIYRLNWIDVWKIVSDIASALAYCHYGMLEEDDGAVSLMLQWQSVLHRDIKAANSKCMKSSNELNV